MARPAKITVDTWSLEKTAQELALAQRLGQLGHAVTAGDTTPQIRRDRFRAAIAEVGPSVVAGRGKDGKPITLGQCYERIYGTAFIAPDHHDNGEGV